MTTIFGLAIVLAVPGINDDPRSDDARSLFERIEALQKAVNDFRCEFEGTVRFKGKNAETTPVDEDGTFESFSGTYIWQRGGDIRCESLHRQAVNGQITRHTLVMRARDKQAYSRMSLGHPREVPNIHAPTRLLAAREGLGELFVLHALKAMAADNNYELSVSDRQWKGGPCKLVSMSIRGIRDSLSAEYFIDMERNGHVVRVQNYFRGKKLSGWFNVELDVCSVNGTKFWVPISGESVGMLAVENGRPILTNGPTSIRKLRIVRSTLEFNKHPGPEVFSASYAAHPPLSEGLQKLEHEFALQVERFRTERDDPRETKKPAPESHKEAGYGKDPDQSAGFRPSAWVLSGSAVLILVGWLAVRGHARASRSPQS